MIEGHVVHDCDPGLEKRNRAVALIYFTDENVAVAHPGTGKGGVRVNEVLHICAVHDRWVFSSAVQNPTDHANRGGLTARAGDTNAQTGGVEQLSEKFCAGDDGGTNTTCGLDVGYRLLNSSGSDQDLIGSAHAAAILGMKQHPARAQEIKSFGVAPLVKRAVRTLDPSAPGLDDQGEGGHATTADATKKVISMSGHRRNLQASPMRSK